jgi:hypothetical protein
MHGVAQAGLMGCCKTCALVLEGHNAFLTKECWCCTHWVGAKHVLRYLKGTMHFGLMNVGDGELVLHGFLDFDWAGSANDRRSTSGCCFSLGSSMISWFSKKQNYVALSSAETEYMATSSASCEAMASQVISRTYRSNFGHYSDIL